MLDYIVITLLALIAWFVHDPFTDTSVVQGAISISCVFGAYGYSYFRGYARAEKFYKRLYWDK